MEDNKKPTPTILIIGLNILLVAIYTFYLILKQKNPNTAIISLDAIFVAIQFSTCMALWLEEENDVWLFSGLLVVVLGIGAIYYLPRGLL